jgi:hypothetical protein
MATVTSNFIIVLTADIKRQARNSSEKMIRERERERERERAITTEVKEV